MAKTPNYMRLNIHPGEWYVGARYHSIYTVLGSCVSVTAWHPELKLGGMCHFILPTLPRGLKDIKVNAGRYANTALEMMKLALSAQALLTEFQLGLFGGSDTITHFDVGKNNVIYAQQWLAAEQLNANRIDIGGRTSRSVTLHISSGVLIVKHHNMPIINPLPAGINTKRL